MSGNGRKAELRHPHAGAALPWSSAPGNTTSTRPVMVLHVVESFGSGVKNSLLSYVANTPEYDHHLLWATHADTSVSAADLSVFASHRHLPDGHRKRVAAVREAIRRLAPPIVHAHSSWAGMYVRVATRHSARLSIVYTPHGYSFQRQDISATSRGLFRVAEWMLSFNTTAVAACGEHEARLSAWPVRHPPVSVIPNVSHASGRQRHARLDARARPGESGSDLPVVVGAGRLCNAKDPAFFAATITALRASGAQLRAVWMGDGEEHFARTLRDADVEITGWLTPHETWDTLGRASLYLHTARWEGFPLSVLEAAAAGVPVIGRDIGALRDEGLPLLFSRPADVVDLWNRLAEDDEWRAALAFARELAESHDDASQGRALNALYRSLRSVRGRDATERHSVDEHAR